MPFFADHSSNTGRSYFRLHANHRRRPRQLPHRAGQVHRRHARPQHFRYHRPRDSLQRDHPWSGPHGCHRQYSSLSPSSAPQLEQPTATSHFPLLNSALASLSPLGTLILIGAASTSNPPDYSLNYDITAHMGKGTRILGCIEGDSVPAEFIPRLVEYYREGSLPLEKMVRFYDVGVAK